MTDLSTAKAEIGTGPKRPKMQEASLRPDLIAEELQRKESDRELETFRTLINIKVRLEDPAKWNLVIVELLRIISASDDVGEERVMLASLALVNVSFRSCDFEDFAHQLATYWNLEDPGLRTFGRDFEIRDLEWFKLVVTHGYLQVNIGTIYSPEIILMPFGVLQKNYLRYTKYSYFACKTLQTWLAKAAGTDIWWTSGAAAIERDLEAIIFSNWDSCICEIARRNSTEIFPTYLRIMSDKYEGFLHHVFDDCLQNLSWQNESKYTILAEICKFLDDLPKIASSHLPACLFTSLTKNRLKHPGTKLYLTILGKLKTNQWEEIFAESLLRVSAIWESREQSAAIELLWMQWMSPTIAKFPNVFDFLWRQVAMSELQLSRSYLERIADRQGLPLIFDSGIDKILNARVVSISEPVRLNAFAVLCQMKNWKLTNDGADGFVAIKRFLYFNIDTSSIVARKDIAKNFDLLFANLVRLADRDPDAERRISDFLRWLHAFLMGCLELCACYQRKILAMRLYETVLTLTSTDDSRMGVRNSENSRGEQRKLITCATNLRLKINAREGAWPYCDAKSVRAMFTLVFDRVAEVRDRATFMLLQYFPPNVLSPEEREDRWKTNFKYYQSPEFHDIAIGASLEKLRIAWDPKFEPPLYDGRVSTVVDHVARACDQLAKLKLCREKMLSRLKDDSPVYGSLTVVLEVGFLVGPVDGIYDESTVRNILDLVEDVAIFFLGALSAKAETGKYSVSFAEMSQAIENIIDQSDGEPAKCTLSPAHQLLLSCIWMSLKVSCEIAAEVGLIAETEEFARRSVDLIVSVLLKCRHKGAIEAAGLALAKLTKSLSKGKFAGFVETHLTNLMNIDSRDSVNLTRRGAGLSIMFHKIVTSDDRRNCPWLHLAVRSLLNSLKAEKLTERPSTENEDCLVDSPHTRHMHFLRFLVADKALQGQLVPYIEDICLTCFRYLQSSEWTVRSASLQLFGAVVPRLVGQNSARELDYGVGNSVEHFVTHYPTLAEAVMTKLKSITHRISHENDDTCRYIRENSDVAPILTLLSKMSSDGCELVDNCSKAYILEGRRAFHILFKHPVISVRVLASKAYAAFVPLPEIPYELVKLQLESLSANTMDNRQHGQYCAQLYLQRKLKHESQCMSDAFFVRRHRNVEHIAESAARLQLRQLARIVNFWRVHQKSISYTVASALTRCLLETPVALSREDLPVDWTGTHVALSQLTQARAKPGLTEFLDNFLDLSAQLGVEHDTSVLSELFHSGAPHCSAYRAAVMENLRAEPRNLNILVDEALAIFHNPARSETLLSVVRSIHDTTDKVAPEHLPHKLQTLLTKLASLRFKSRPYAWQLRCLCCGIELKCTSFDADDLFVRTFGNMYAWIHGDDIANQRVLCVSRAFAAGCAFREDRSMCVRLDTNTFLEAIVVMLTNESPEIREAAARALQPFVESFLKIPGQTICAKACVHKILYQLLRPCDVSIFPCQEIVASRIFLHLVINVRISGRGKRPFRREDSLSQDDAWLMNVLIGCLRASAHPKEAAVNSSSSESIEVQQIDDEIAAKRQFDREHNLEASNLGSLRTLASAYSFAKKSYLIATIDGSRCPKDHRCE